MPNPEACASSKLPAGGAVGPHWPKGLLAPFTCPHWMKPLWGSDTPTAWPPSTAQEQRPAAGVPSRSWALPAQMGRGGRLALEAGLHLASNSCVWRSSGCCCCLPPPPPPPALEAEQWPVTPFLQFHKQSRLSDSLTCHVLDVARCPLQRGPLPSAADCPHNKPVLKAEGSVLSSSVCMFAGAK